MTNKRFLMLLMAVLTALILCACGDTVEVSAEPDGISTWGADLDPSAQPSLPQTVQTQQTPPAPSRPVTQSSGVLVEDNSGTAPSPSPSPSPSPTAAVSPAVSSAPVTSAPSTSTPSTSRPAASTSPTPARPTPPAASNPVETSPEPSDSVSEPGASPVISPPAPASTATASQVAQYRGRQLSELIDDLGYPSYSEYEDVDEDDPENTDRIGTLYFSGFTVTTLRSGDSEVITAIIED